MVDDMNDLGELRAQVTGLQTGHNELKQDITSVRGEVAQLTRDMNSGFSGILNRIDSKFQNQTSSIWPPLAILTTVLLTIGGALYLPIREGTSKNEAMIEVLRGQMVTRVEHEQHWKESAETERRLGETLQAFAAEGAKNARELSYLQGQLHPLKAQ